MAHSVDLDYDPASLVGPLDLSAVREFEVWWLDHEFPFKLDESYIEHLSKFHGGRPRKKCFKTKAGRERVLDRFLNFVTDYKHSELGVYHVEVMRCNIEDRLTDFLLPFAVLFAGDLLCFDYSVSETPAVVVWLHEESARDDAPVTEPVAADFSKFLALLYERREMSPKRKKKG